MYIEGLKLSKVSMVCSFRSSSAGPRLTCFGTTANQIMHATCSAHLQDPDVGKKSHWLLLFLSLSWKSVFWIGSHLQPVPSIAGFLRPPTGLSWCCLPCSILLEKAEVRFCFFLFCLALNSKWQLCSFGPLFLFVLPYP